MTESTDKTTTTNQTLRILSGPILRHTNTRKITLWLATNHNVNIKLTLKVGSAPAQTYSLDKKTLKTIQAGENLYFHLIDFTINAESALPFEEWIGYQLSFNQVEQSKAINSDPRADTTPKWQLLTDLAPDICYPNKSTPGFVLYEKIGQLLHGSCRKPHFSHDTNNHISSDGIALADQYLAEQIKHNKAHPSLLMLSGDQIYADDVATPMLVAVHQLITEFSPTEEIFKNSTVDNASQLHTKQPYYGERSKLLPDSKTNDKVKKKLFFGVKKPIFTSDSAENHLISLSEMLAMYLLVWSPEAWKNIKITQPDNLPILALNAFAHQNKVLEHFISQLSQVRRVMAHLPCAMIFDDHDVTDDWNLTAAWEQTAYEHDFSRQIVGNSLISYLICQAWGNAPEHFSDSLLTQVQKSVYCDDINLKTTQQTDLTYQLLKFEDWHYQWQTQPKLIVLDTRTQRWWSESDPYKPSGLMDWESLTELQQNLKAQESVILVSAAPIFGVKLIEVIQQFFTWIGKPLMVDAENWMAHKGSASTLLNMFRHPKTPQNFVILSGDVHYSFAAKIKIKGRLFFRNRDRNKNGRHSPDIWQITSSGLRNAFPKKLLDTLDRMNRWLYAPRSPLNWFTRRRKMTITPYKPDNASAGERLINTEGIGLVCFDETGQPTKICQLTQSGAIQFIAE